MVAKVNSGRADDILIRNREWLGLLTSYSTGFSQVRMYPRYIRNVPYHRFGWW